MADTKKLYIKTYGCQMNVNDSERMAETLGAEGYVQTDTADDAVMILLNTCHIREKAAEKIVHGQEDGQSNRNFTGRNSDGENGVDPTRCIAVVDGCSGKLHVCCVQHQLNAHENDDGVFTSESTCKSNDKQQC